MSDSIKKKIAALMRMTSASGCTEAEALAAAEKAATLMREHGLSEADVTVGEATVKTGSKGRGVRDELWGVVGHCTNTAPTFRSRRGMPGAELVFVGRDPGPEIAAYLVAVLNRAIDAGIVEFKLGKIYRLRRTNTTRRAAVRDFTTGMIGRLSRRLVEIFKALINKEANAVACTARDERFSDAKPFTVPTAKIRFDDAVWSGWEAGNKVNLSQGVGGPLATPQRIGGA